VPEPSYIDAPSLTVTIPDEEGWSKVKLEAWVHGLMSRRDLLLFLGELLETQREEAPNG